MPRFHHRANVATGEEILTQFTAEEETQADADAAAAAVEAEKAATESANGATLRDRLTNRLANLRTIRDSIDVTNAVAAAGTLFAALTLDERKTMRVLVTDDIWMVRLLLRLLDGTD